MPTCPLGLLSVLACARVVAAACEAQCAYPCVELNGPLHIECADCSAEKGHKCYPGAADFDTWSERSQTVQRAAVGAQGTIQRAAVGAQDERESRFQDSDTVELTHKSFVVIDKHYVLAAPRRNVSTFEKLAASPELADFIDA